MPKPIADQLRELATGAGEVLAQKLTSIITLQTEEIGRLRDEISEMKTQVGELGERVTQLENEAYSSSDEQGENASAANLTDAPKDPRAALGEAELAPAGDGLDQGVPPPTLTEDSYVHHELAERYGYIVGQLLVGLAVKVLGEQSSATGSMVREAELVAELCKALFQNSDINRDALSRLTGTAAGSAEVARILNDVTSLRRRIADVGGHGWNFVAEAGQPVSWEWQKAWTGCQANAPIQFVVAPAYMAHGKVWSHQLVYTAYESDKPRSRRSLNPLNWRTTEG